MLIKYERMHIHRSNNVTVSGKATSFTCPISSFGLVFMLTDRTLATCSSFGASKAHDVSLFRLMGQVIDIFAVFPQGHALVVVPAAIPVADTMRIPDEESAHLLLLAEGDHFSCGFVSHITNPAFCSCLDLILGFLDFLPPSGVLLASGLLLGNLAQLLGSLTFERPDTASGDDHGLTCVCLDGGKMGFNQVYRCMNTPRPFFRYSLFDTDMQFKTVIPDKATGTAVIFQLNWQDDGFTSFAHRQNHSSVLFAYSLSRPFDRIEVLLTPGIFHLHLRMGFAKLACGIDVGKERMHHHLYRLAMQRKLSFGCFLQFIATGPLAMSHSCLLIDLTTQVPHTGRFHLSSFQASKQLWGGLQSIHTHCIHAMILLWIQVVCKWGKPDGRII